MLVPDAMEGLRYALDPTKGLPSEGWFRKALALILTTAWLAAGFIVFVTTWIPEERVQAAGAFVALLGAVAGGIVGNDAKS